MSTLAKFTAELTALLVGFAIAGAVVGGVLTYRSRVEDLAMPSRLVTVVAVWDADGGEICRAFSYRDLLLSLDTLRIRFDLSAADVESCRETFAAYNAGGRWPRQLEENERGYPSYSFEVEDTSPLTIMVHRGTGDPADWAETRYRVDADGTISHVTTDSASAGQGLGPVFGAFLGIVAWFFVAALQLLRLLAGRRGA
jgi:hypothetical protein